MRRAPLLALLVALACAGRADAAIFMNADATGDRGFIDLQAVATTDIPRAVFGELAGGTTERIAEVELPFWRVHPEHGPVGGTALTRTVRWRCDRLDRDFFLAGRRPDGIVETAYFSIRTPSCRNRLTLTVPRRVPMGGVVKAKVRDTWGTGLTTARLCFIGDCRDIALADGEDVRTMRFRAGWSGVRRFILRAPSQRVVERIGVGVRPPRAAASGPTVLTTGDSLMQSVEAMIQDRLAGRAQVVSDVKVGAALSKPLVVNWMKLAREQVAEHHPHATAIFLGTNDFYAMTTPEGREIACCGEAWVTEYARRARKIMRTYAQGNTSMVLWLAVPAARDERRIEPARAVNDALRRAAVGLPTVFILPVDEMLTPGMRYRESMVHQGQMVKVRETDGIHLSIPGARIVAAIAIDLLRGVGILGR